MTEPISEDISPPANPSPAHSPLTRRQWHRRQRLTVAGIVVVVLASCLLIYTGVIRLRVQAPPPPLLPAELMQALIDKAQSDKSPLFQVSDFAVNDELIEKLRGLDFLETVIVYRGVLSDQALEVFTTLPKLQHLRLRLSPITDEGMKTIARCESLLQLNLPHAKCTAQGVAMLAQMPNLRQLRLGSDKLLNDVTFELAKFPRLRMIHLNGVPVTNAGLKTLAGIGHLESLYLDDSAVTDSGWLWLFENHPELHVHVNQGHHDRDPHAHPHHDGSS